MSTASDGSVRLEFHIPSRGLIGFRGNFLTSTKGTGIINTIFDGYSPYKGDFQYRKQGSLIAFEGGEAVTYGLFAAQERGTLFIGTWRKGLQWYGYRTEWQGRGYRAECLQDQASDQYSFPLLLMRH